MERNLRFNTVIVCAVWCVLMMCTDISAAEFYIRSLADGRTLSDLTVNTIYKDSLGYVNFGTDNSVETFDGWHVRHYRLPGDESPQKRVNAIAEDGRGNLLVGNGFGLWRLDRHGAGKYTRIAYPVAADRHGVNAIARSGDSLLIGGNAGLFVYHSGSDKVRPLLTATNPFAPTAHINDIAVADSVAYLATRGGVSCIDLRDMSVRHSSWDMMGNPGFNSIAISGDKAYLGTATHGLAVMRLPSGRIERGPDVGCSVISALDTGGDSLLVVGTDGGGVVIIDLPSMTVSETLRHKPGHENVLRSNSVYSLLLDRDNRLWVGFYQLGVDYSLFTTGEFTTYSGGGFSTAGMPVRTINLLGDGVLIGTRDGLYYVDKSRGVSMEFKRPDMRSDMVIASAVADGRFYIGTYGGGMYVFDPETLKLSPFLPDGGIGALTSGHVFSIASDGGGDLWIGTSDGLYRYSGRKEKAHYTSANSHLPEGNVYEVMFDSSGKGWICTENGMAMWNPSQQEITTSVFPARFVQNDKIRVVYEDRGGRLYFLPDKGQVTISDLAMTHFRKVDAEIFGGADAKAIIEDAQGHMWVPTHDGIFHWDPSLDTSVKYGFIDGVPGPVFNNCIPAKDEEGNLWFGNSKGLVVWHPGFDSDPAPAYPWRITGVWNDSDTSAEAKVEEDDSRYVLTFPKYTRSPGLQLSAFDYSMPDVPRYQYRLDGKDTTWIDLPGEPLLWLTDIGGGTRHLWIRYRNLPASQREVVVNMPQPWTFWVMIVAAVAVVMLTVALVVVVRRRRRRRRNRNRTFIGITRRPRERDVEMTRITMNESDQIEDRLHDVLDKEKPYTRPDLQLPDLARMVGVSTYKLSIYFSQSLGVSYYDFINNYRVAEFKRLATETTNERYTLSVLSERAGFSSRATFFRYFKKTQGETPAAYMRRLNPDR